jgi:RHS repeat-associated protein
VADLLYQGDRRDPSTGDYQFGSRPYDPSKASFLTPDSYRVGPAAANLGISVDPLTENTYAYVNGDPVNLSDPTGHGIACDNGGNCGDIYDATVREGVSPNSPGGRAALQQQRAVDAHESQAISAVLNETSQRYPADWCLNPFDPSSEMPCADATYFNKNCQDSTLYGELQCEGEQYYIEYWISYTRLQAYFALPRAEQLRVDQTWVAQQVVTELSGIWGDIYIDNTKTKLIPGVDESPEDERTNIHLATIGPFRFNYSDLGLGDVAPGVGPNGMVDFYNVYGPDPLPLSEFRYTNA